MRTLSLPFLALLAACTDLPPDAVDVEGTQQEDIRFFDQMRRLMFDQADLATDSPSSAALQGLWGRATAHLEDAGCSAFLIDDAILVTAEHCVPSDEQVVARFGNYGLNFDSFGVAETEARHELRALGLDEDAVQAVSSDDLTRWTCDLLESQPEDVAYFECEPNLIDWTPHSYTQTFALLPGHLWGQLEVRARRHNSGTNIGVLHAPPGQWSSGGGNDVLLSHRGKILDRSFNAPGYGSSRDNFKFDSDTVYGSSGGAVVRDSDGVAFGVVGGCMFWQGDCDDERNTGLFYRNYGAYLDGRAEDYADGGTFWSMGPTDGDTRWLGSSTIGTATEFSCPQSEDIGYDTLAIGVIGTKDPTYDRVGNFGLICAPHLDPGGQPDTTHLDRAVVVSAGADDLLGGPYATDEHGDEYLRYRNDIRGSTVPNDVPYANRQHVQMCPPSFFVVGVQGRVSNGRLARITNLRCGNPQDGTEMTVWVDRYTTPIGYDDVGGMTMATCGGEPEGSYVSGMTVRTDYRTQGLRFDCRREDG